MSGGLAQRERERTIFEGFLAVASDFAARISGDWTQPDDDPPDVLFKDGRGHTVGVELKAWINEGQIAQGKKREALEARFFDALGPHTKNPNPVVAFVWLRPVHDVWSRPVRDQAPGRDEAQAFRDELLSLVSDIDGRWAACGHEILQGETVTAFGNRPTLTRYLGAVEAFPRTVIDPGEQPWIGFPMRGAAYSEKDMLTPLQDLIADTRVKYEEAKAARGLDWFVLLIHYDGRAFQYNSPIETLDWDLGVFADDAAFMVFALDTLSEEPSPWDEVYLFDAVAGRSVKVHPR